MEIHEILIKNYKQLQDFQLKLSSTNSKLSPLSLRFLVGENGSGKSSLIEAIGLIFTRAMHDESPGFEYEIIYSVINKIGNKTYVYLTNQPGRKLTGRLQVRTHSQKSKVKHAKIKEYRFSEQTELHPNRIFSLASGPNNELEDVLLWSPLKSLHSDLYDKDEKISSGREIEINYLESLYKKFLLEPVCLNFDVKTAVYILIALFFSMPRVEQERVGFLEKRRALLQDIPGLTPVGFSLTIGEKQIQSLRVKKANSENRKLPQFIDRFYRLLEHSWNQSYCSIEHTNDGQEPKVHRNFYFPMTIENEDVFRVMTIGEEEISPLDLLTTFMVASRAGYLKEAHIQFSHGHSKQILDENELSDGEWLWLCRMGLVLLAQNGNVDNVLFLFDEPDVFLNERWIIDFVSDLHRYSQVSKFNGKFFEKGYMNHEYFIATHSTLMLTDALPTQTYIFQKRNRTKENEIELEAAQVQVSTFAADRAEISARLFTNKQRTGTYAQEKINQAIEERNLKQLNLIIDEVGPGFDRFRLEDVRLSINPLAKD
ncbi:AAA family ATPase [Priestia aryabhattai]|uniref:AAA family ATPase n=1 Tax=Priestia aryabhattai TaxID=412384 RepID=UPI0035ABB690